VLVAQSMGGLTAPLVCERLPGVVQLLVLVAAMVPAPGEAPGDWWANTGHGDALREQARRDGRETDGDFDPVTMFLHDLPPDVLAEAMTRGGGQQSETPFEKPWPLDAWPDVPTRFLLCCHDRFFPADFQRRVVKERLGIVPDEMDGGHLPALHSPEELVERLEAYRIAAGID
jgi:pimeloyl-ACP methyl ester carboxylesterase